MKTRERHELKENDLARALEGVGGWAKPRTGQLVTVVVAVIVIAGGALGVMAWRSSQKNKGQELLAEAMVVLNTAVVPVTESQPGEVPAAASISAKGTFSTEAAKLTAAVPKLKAAAEAYPDTIAGITARYHLGASLAALGQPKEAVAQFDDVIKRAGADSIYGRMAQLGRADAQARGGDVDAAIATWKTLAEKKDAGLPEDAILMELGRAYQLKGAKDDAKKAFDEIVTKHPDSPYVADARKELDSLKS